MKMLKELSAFIIVSFVVVVLSVVLFDVLFSNPNPIYGCWISEIKTFGDITTTGRWWKQGKIVWFTEKKGIGYAQCDSVRIETGLDVQLAEIHSHHGGPDWDNIFYQF